MEDLDHMTLGMVYDIFIEKSNDSYEWDELATDEDIFRLVCKDEERREEECRKEHKEGAS